MKQPAPIFIIHPPRPGDNRPRNTWGVLTSFGKAYAEYYRKRDAEAKRKAR